VQQALDDSPSIKPPGLQISEHDDPDGVRRLALIGELDHSTAPDLADHLRRLRQQSAHVRLDLSQLTFIDSSGIRELARAVLDARRDGTALEITKELTDQVRRVLDLAGISTRL
jgi:anti-anti-sigma factor